MMASGIGKENIGKIAERIVANELEFEGFVVRDLNIEGFAANVDLLAVKGGNAWQVQVKGCRYDTRYENAGWWFHYGYCNDKHIQNSTQRMFNVAGSSFRADVVALVCIRTPSDYQSIVVPVETAEKAAQINLNYAYRTKKKDDSKEKPGIVWMSFYLPEKSDPQKIELMKQEQELLKPFRDREDKWCINITSNPSNTLNATKE